VATISIDIVSKLFYSAAYPQGLLALDRTNFRLADREFVCLVGPSGCGKSTILNLVGGLDQGYAGRIEIDGHPVLPGRIHPVRVGFVFQEHRLLPWLTIRKNIYFALQAMGVSFSEWRERTDLWLERVGLAGFADSHPHELSGGMQQRSAIARAFAVDPEVLLMDEPFSGLDELTARSMREQVLQLWDKTRTTILFVTHNCFEACFLADRILVMSARPGRLSCELKVELPRPRDYESSELFELSVKVARILTRADSQPSPLPL
jgi:ABC-type nitrate/sulfonate/bicarbonate transport system ATPase subunit